MVIGLAEVQGNAIGPVDVLMGLNEGVEPVKVCEWGLIMDMLIGALVTLVTDAALAEMMDAWMLIVGGEDWEVMRLVSVRVKGQEAAGVAGSWVA